jgi:hypothetical protein
MSENVTIVTGLWDLNRSSIEGWANRSFDTYKQKFFEFLETDVAMVIYIPSSLKGEVESIRKNKQTFIVVKENKDFKSWNPFFKQINNIRTNPDWVNGAGWLSGSPQAQLEYYNAMMFTKMFMVNDASIINPFGHDYFFWVDGGLTSTVNKGYFTHDKTLNKLPNYVKYKKNKFLFITYPYTSNEEIHGFKREGMSKYCGVKHVNYVARGGFFGGHKSLIKKINGEYYHILENSLSEGYMGADECIFTILCHRFRTAIERFEINGDGLVWPFFEKLKNFVTNVNDDNYNLIPNLSEEVNISKQVNTSSEIIQPNLTKNNLKCSLYVLTFNSPDQLSTLMESFKQVPNFLDSFSGKFIIDNSLKEECFGENLTIAAKNKFNLIKKNNLGICGGRQYVAEHFDSTDSDYMIFFEDDMFLNPPSEQGFCRNGFRKYVSNIASKSIKIMESQKLDFLKWSFSEFYGDNKTQWAWYNVPQKIRTEHWPHYDRLPEHGLDENAPSVKYKHIHLEDDLPYATGDCYYCNWPVMVSKKGNHKMFLKTKWARPYEQTWMSHIFQETIAGNINSGILLASPITHDRFVHYPAEHRKES